MRYIYTVKPFKEAIKIAIEQNAEYRIDEYGRIHIYGIQAESWPGGETVTMEKPAKGSVRTKMGWWVPLRYVTITEKTEDIEEKDAPTFIKDLYTAIKADCTGVSCSKCPLSLTMPVGCEMLGHWIHERWPEL